MLKTRLIRISVSGDIVLRVNLFPSTKDVILLKRALMPTSMTLLEIIIPYVPPTINMKIIIPDCIINPN